MDTILDAAKRRRTELIKELEKVDIFLETYQTLVLELRMESANESGTTSPSSTPNLPVDGERTETTREAKSPNEAPAKRLRVNDNPRPADVVAAAVEVIREQGRPMSRRAIHTALKERGLYVRGADEVKALGTMLWRSGKAELVQIEGKGYGLKGVDYNAQAALRSRELDLGLHRT